MSNEFEKPMDPFRLCVAFGPLTLYLLLLGCINLLRRPWLSTGTRDLLLLGLAVSGLLFVGPLELFAPLLVRNLWPAWVTWLLLGVLYWLTLCLAALTLRPRLSILNVTPEELKPALEAAATKVDSQAAWQDQSLLLPCLHVQLQVEPFPAMRSVSLVSVGPRQSYQGWKRLEGALAAELRGVETQPNFSAVGFLAAGSLLAGVLVTKWIADPQAVTKAFVDLLK